MITQWTQNLWQNNTSNIAPDFPLAAFAAAECVVGTRALFCRSRDMSFLISGPFSSGEIGEFLALAVAIDKLCENEVELSN